VGNFLIEVGKECKEMKLFIDGSELVVSKDSFFKGKDLFPVHSVVVDSSYLCQGSTGPCAQCEQVLFNQQLAKQDLIKVKTKSKGKSCFTSPH
jgi:hypothetical protein